MNEAFACNLEEIKPNQPKVIQMGDEIIALFNVEGHIFAVEEKCPHRGGPLSEGQLIEKVIRCNWHGAKFCLETGDIISPPSPRPLKNYQVTISENKVFLSSNKT